MIEPPGKPGIALCCSTKPSNKDAYASTQVAAGTSITVTPTGLTNHRCGGSFRPQRPLLTAFLSRVFPTPRHRSLRVGSSLRFASEGLGTLKGHFPFSGSAGNDSWRSPRERALVKRKEVRFMRLHVPTIHWGGGGWLRLSQSNHPPFLTGSFVTIGKYVGTLKVPPEMYITQQGGLAKMASGKAHVNFYLVRGL